MQASRSWLTAQGARLRQRAGPSSATSPRRQAGPPPTAMQRANAAAALRLHPKSQQNAAARAGLPGSGPQPESAPCGGKRPAAQSGRRNKAPKVPIYQELVPPVDRFQPTAFPAPPPSTAPPLRPAFRRHADAAKAQGAHPAGSPPPAYRHRHPPIAPQNPSPAPPVPCAARHNRRAAATRPAVRQRIADRPRQRFPR